MLLAEALVVDQPHADPQKNFVLKVGPDFDSALEKVLNAGLGLVDCFSCHFLEELKHFFVGVLEIFGEVFVGAVLIIMPESNVTS